MPAQHFSHVLSRLSIAASGRVAPNVLWSGGMAERRTAAPPLELDLAPVPLPRRAAFRRVLAALKAEGRPFVVGGPLALSVHAGRLVDDALEILFRPEDAPAAHEGLATAGFRVEPRPDGVTSRVAYGEHHVLLRWGLPPPLGGPLDDAWFDGARRTFLVDLRVRIAPAEELVWTRIVALGETSAADGALDAVLLRRGAALDWDRLLGRLAGQEELLPGILFLFLHRHGEAGRRALPGEVLARLLRRLNSAGPPAVEPHAP
jgi:hypothetical protein